MCIDTQQNEISRSNVKNKLEERNIIGKKARM